MIVPRKNSGQVLIIVAVVLLLIVVIIFLIWFYYNNGSKDIEIINTTPLGDCTTELVVSKYRHDSCKYSGISEIQISSVLSDINMISFDTNIEIDPQIRDMLELKLNEKYVYQRGQIIQNLSQLKLPSEPYFITEHQIFSSYLWCKEEADIKVSYHPTRSIVYKILESITITGTKSIEIACQ